MDDFFTAKEHSSLAPANDQTFANAIESRFRGLSSMPMPSLPDTLPRLPPPPQVPSSSATLDNNFIAISPSSFAEHLKPTTLVLDIRPFHAYTNARLPSSLALTVPSTLLKRANFSMQRLSMMLPSQASRAKLQTWSKCETIIVYDADSAALPPNSNLYGLLKKFRGEGFTGTLGYLLGGFQAFWREQRAQVDTSPPVAHAEDDDEVSKEPSSLLPPSSKAHNQSDATPTSLMPKRLPMSAFSVSSTTAAGHSPPATKSSSRSQPLSISNNTAAPAQANSASNPFYDTVRQNLELEQGITETIPLRLSSRVRRRVKDLPFPWLRSIARAAEPRMNSPPEEDPDNMASEPPSSDAQTQSESSETDDSGPTNTRRSSDPVSGDGAEALAMQFYKLEVAEQRRLMSVMTHHTQESTLVASKDGSLPPDVVSKFPFSITAGVEKGAKNRYRHIWPFEHARVRLRNRAQKSASGQPLDDYVNASYVQPLGTNKRYIATQGPMPATFVDFWTLCWEQDVHVVVMLTQEYEGAMEKCAKYWSEGIYGPLRLKLVSDTGDAQSEADRRLAGFFPPVSQGPEQDRPGGNNDTIRRVFELTHIDCPLMVPRKIIQLQYLGWSDMNVPDDPRSLLKFLKDVDTAVQETNHAAPLTGDESDTLGSAGSTEDNDHTGSTTGIWKGTKGVRPVLLHCSAGVGRTGGYIAIDAILDGIRRELVKESYKESQHELATRDMEVDGPQLLNPGESSKSNESSKTPSGPVSDASKRLDEVQMDVDQSDISAELWQQWAKGPAGKAASSEAVPSSSINNQRSLPSGYTSGTGSIGQRATLPPTHAILPNSATTPFPPTQAPWPEARRPFPYGLHFVSPTPDRPRTFSAPSQHEPPTFSNMNDPMFTEMRHPSAISSSPSSVSPSPLSFYRSRGHSVGPGTGSGEGSGSSTQAQARSWLGTSLRRTIVSSSPAPMDPPGPASSSSPQPQSSNSRSLSPFLGTSDPMSAVTLSSTSSSGGSMGLGPFSAVEIPGARTSSSSNLSSHVLDYVVPRSLHRSDFDSPPFLSSYDDPVLTVLQGMREQRMSLVQTLRQYVFIHAAIVEGALQIADEESTRPREPIPAGAQSNSSGTEPRPRRAKRREGQERPAGRSADGHSITTSGSTVSTVSTGKRGASPTELVKEDDEGKVKLAKRPSTKKNRTSPEDNNHRQAKPTANVIKRQRPSLGYPQRTARPGAPNG